MKDEDIEILDLDDNIDKEEKNGKKTSKKGKKTGKKRRLKKGLIQTVFCLASLIFIIGCCIFYGSRLIKYYKMPMRFCDKYAVRQTNWGDSASRRRVFGVLISGFGE